MCLRGRILYLCDDPELIRKQIAGDAVVGADGLRLLDNISTDEIIPAWACYHYDETLARFAYVGLRGGTIGIDELRSSGVSIVVSGYGKGCGSSRETAPLAEVCAGIDVVFARSFARIYRQNCTNLGVATCTDFGQLERLRRGESVSVEDLTADLDALSRSIISAGGLLAWQKSLSSVSARASLCGTGGIEVEVSRSEARARTFVEKILLKYGRSVDGRPLRSIDVGQSVLVEAHLRFSHDYTTAMAASQFRHGYGGAARVVNPGAVLAFRDHLSMVGSVMPEKRRKLGFLERADALATEQAEFCAEQGIRLLDVDSEDLDAGICHTVVVEQFALPGQVIVGTDSHTCTAGAVGALAFGVGSTDIAFAWASGTARTTVPESVRVELHGSLGAFVCAKDVMLALLAEPCVRAGELSGAVVEFDGEALATMSLDERATLANMAVEAGALTGVAIPDSKMVQHIAEVRRLDHEQIEAAVVRPDRGAHYRRLIQLDLSALSPMVATPGDPHNGLPLAEYLSEAVSRVDIAYGGSCTGGKASDMDMYAAIFEQAEMRGERVSPHVQCYVQFGSYRVQQYAQLRGYVSLFERIGAVLLGPGCGACIGSGPGVSSRSEQITISSANRNFPGRSGPGRVYLASPYVVAASAIAGCLTLPQVLPR